MNYNRLMSKISVTNHEKNKLVERGFLTVLSRGKIIKKLISLFFLPFIFSHEEASALPPLSNTLMSR